MAFSAKVFMANTCSVVLLPGWYADCSNGMCFSSLFHVLLIKQIVKIFCKIESRMMGLGLTTGPLCFPGCCNGFKNPTVSSVIFPLFQPLC